MTPLLLDILYLFVFRWAETQSKGDSLSPSVPVAVCQTAYHEGAVEWLEHNINTI